MKKIYKRVTVVSVRSFLQRERIYKRADEFWLNRGIRNTVNPKTGETFIYYKEEPTR